MKLSLDGYTQITKGKIKKGDLVERLPVYPLQEAFGLIGKDINDCSDWKCYRKMPKPKTPPSLPSGLPIPPNDYVFLGRVKDIVTPKSWGGAGWNDKLDLAIICFGEKSWFKDPNGWMRSSSESYIAAKVGSPLYDMQNFAVPATPAHWNPEYSHVKCLDGYRFLEKGETPAIGDKWFCRKNWLEVDASQTKSPIGSMQLPFARPLSKNKSPDLAFEIVQLKAKLQSAEEALSARTTELNSVKNELLEVKRQLSNVEKARGTYYNMYHAAKTESIKVKAELAEIKKTAKKLNSLVNS
jgi:hypothetical protein